MDGRTIGLEGYSYRLVYRLGDAWRSLRRVSDRGFTLQPRRRRWSTCDFHHREVSPLADALIFLGSAILGLAFRRRPCNSQFLTSSSCWRHRPTPLCFLQSLVAAVSASNPLPAWVATSVGSGRMWRVLSASIRAMRSVICPSISSALPFSPIAAAKRYISPK